jgi:diacylglycerol O-acyltransferase
MFTTLPTHIDDVAERVNQIQACTVGAKAEHKAVGADMLQNWAEYAAPNTINLASRLYSSLGLAANHRPVHNVIISNVPGPPFPLYYAGAKMIAAYPMGPAMEGVGLNITVFSYQDSIDFGFMADREMVPDVWDLADHVSDALAELQAAAGISPAPKSPATGPSATTPPASGTPTDNAPAKKATTKKATTKTAPAARKSTAKKAPAKAAATKKAPAKKAPTPAAATN